MKKYMTLLILFVAASLYAQSSYPAVQFDFNSITEEGYSGFGISYKERGLDLVDLSYEISANLLTYEVEGLDDASNANLAFAIGPFFNLDLGENSAFVPFIGISGGLGYLFRDETLNAYADDLEELTDNIETEKELPPDGAFFHWNASVGFDWFIFGRADYGHAGINFSYNIGKFDHIAVGFTYDFGFFDSF